MTDSQTAPPTAAPRKRRRLRKLFLWSVALLVVGRVVLAFAAVPAIRATAGLFGLGCEVRSLDLAILAGDVELHGLRVWPEGGSPDEPILELEYAMLDVATSKLFRGELYVRRVEADGLDVYAQRDADGAWNFEPVVASFLAPKGDADDDATEDDAEDEDRAEFDGFQFDLPFTVEAVRGSHLRLHLADALAEPALDTTVTAAVRLSDLGNADRRTRLLVAARGPVVLDALEVSGEASTTRDELDLGLDVRLRGFAPRPLAGYFEFIGLEPVADRLDADARLSVEGRRSESGGTRFALHVERTDWKADAEECLALDDWSVAVDIAPAPALVVEPLEVRGARAIFGRDGDGRPEAAGFAFVGLPASAPTDAPAPDERPVEAPPKPADEATRAPARGLAEMLPFPIRVEGITVTESALRFDDQVIDADDAIALELGEFRLGTLDSAAPEEATDWSAVLAAPGTLGTIELSGTLTPFARTAHFGGSLATTGGDLRSLEPYLENLGLESDWKDGRFAARLDTELTPQDGGAWSIDLALRDVSLGEAEEPWFALGSASLDELVIDPAGRRIALTEARVAGLAGSALRTEAGAWKALGLQPHVLEDGQVVVHVAGAGDRSGEPDAQPEPGASAPEDGADGEVPASPWRIEVARFAIEETDLAIRDEALEPPLDLRLDDLGLELTDLAIGGDETATRRAELRVWLREPGLANDLQITGDLNSRPGALGLSWDLSIDGEGLAPTILTPYLEPLGIRIVDEDAGAHAKLNGSLALTDSGVELDVDVTDFALGPEGDPFVQAGALKLAGLRVDGNTIHVGELSLTEPSARFARDADGALLAAGLRFEPPRPAEPDAEPDAAPDAGEDATTQTPETVAVVVDDREVHDPFTALDALGIEVELERLALNAARLRWRDDALEEPVDATFLLDSSVDGLALRRGAAAAQWMVRGQFEGQPPTMQLDGELSLDPQDIRIQGRVTGEHLDLERVAVYLPPTIRSDAQDSRLQLDFQLRLSANESGGRGLLVECTDLALRDSNAEQPALAIDSMRLDVPRIDVPGRAFEIGEVTTSGVEMHVHRDADARIHALSMLIDPSAAPAASAAVEPAPERTTRRVSGRAVAADSNLPEITLGKLDVGIDRLVFTDALQGEGAAPLVVTMRASIAEPQVLMNSTPGDLEPYRLDLTLGASPLVEQFGTQVVIAPFGDQPRLESTIALRGLNGAGIVELMPRLASAVDADGLRAGEFDAHLEVLLDARRRGLTGFELRRGFGIDVLVDGVAYRAEPGGEVLAGLASLEVNAPRIVPARKEVRIQRIELVDPVGRVERDERGVHALGLVVDPVALQAALAPPADQDASPEDAETAPAPETSAPSDAGADGTARVVEAGAPRREEPQGEVRVDDLLISGLDFRFDDRTFDPPLEFPLTGMSFEVSRFTTLALTERRPIRVNAYVEAGEVPLGDPHPPALLFDEASLRGNVSIYPALDGTVTAGLSNLALRALRGPAAASGVTIGEGTMDGKVRVRFKGEDGMRIDIDTVFRDLSVSEPSDGPISRYLGIAMPLDTAIFALRKSNGNVEISPPTVSMDASGISAAEITRVATQAIAKEITLAVARSPFRLTKGVADTAGDLTGNIPLVGGVTGGIFGGVSNLMGGGEEEELPPIGNLTFYVGDVNLLPEVRPQLEEAIRRMRKDKNAQLVLIHEFTQEDIDRAMELANPSAEDCRELARGLRRKRAELLRTRDEVTAEVRAQLLTGQQEEAARSTARLRALDAEVGRTEAALDKTLALLQPGAERRAERRGREAALAVAQARLDAVVQALRDAGVKKLDDRLDVRIPRPRPAETDEAEASTSKGGRVKLLMN